jgi:hypothetical protein
MVNTRQTTTTAIANKALKHNRTKKEVVSSEAKGQKTPAQGRRKTTSKDTQLLDGNQDTNTGLEEPEDDIGTNIKKFHLNKL